MVKGQLIPFVFLVFLVSGLMIGYIFFNTYYGWRYKLQALQISIIDVVGNVLQSLKNYLAIALSYSSHQALREHACVGGAVGAGPWICNGPNPLSVQQSKDCLEKYTIYYFNVYYDMFSTSLPVNITKYDNFNKISYGVEENKVFSGEYDEGYFWVNSSGATVIVFGTNRDIMMMENLNTSDFVTKNRYWYLFRNFYEWAMDDVYSPCICSIIGCSCSSGSGEEECSSCADPAENCAENALNDLQRRFDDNVRCIKDKMCCKQGIGPVCLEPTDCIPWQNSCMGKCEHECAEPSIYKKPCPAVPTSGREEECTLTADKSLKKFIRISFSPDGNESKECWYEGRVSAGYKYTCEDSKYYVPSDKGPVPLTFSVTAYAFWRDTDVCKFPCPYGC